MVTSKFLIIRVVSDVAGFVIVVAAALTLSTLDLPPFQRGFFCDDESIQHPYHDNTVGSNLVVVLGILTPVVFIFVFEALLQYTVRKQQQESDTSLNKKSFLKDYIGRVASQLSVFLIGAAVCVLLTEFLKLTVGRLRPHFLNLCDPDPSSFNCSHGYITEFRCRSTASAYLLQDSRKSFPSGHSSFVCYSVTYLVMYWQIRLPYRDCRLLRTMFQTLVILGSLYVCVSRISDYKHHWSDVLAGMLLGVTVAVLTIVFVSDLCRASSKEDDSRVILPMTYISRSLNMTHNQIQRTICDPESGFSKGN